MKKSPWIILSVLVLAPLLVMVASRLPWNPPPYEQVDNRGLEQLMAAGVKVVDIRLPSEWRETGVVEGSYLVTAFDTQGRLRRGFAEEFERIAAKDQPVAVICRTGNRTDVLARALMEEAGYQQVYNVTRGISRWIADGNKVRRDCPSLAMGSQC